MNKIDLNCIKDVKKIFREFLKEEVLINYCSEEFKYASFEEFKKVDFDYEKLNFNYFIMKFENKKKTKKLYLISRKNFENQLEFYYILEENGNKNYLKEIENNYYLGNGKVTGFLTDEENGISEIKVELDYNNKVKHEILLFVSEQSIEKEQILNHNISFIAEKIEKENKLSDNFNSLLFKTEEDYF
jgi:hypothetical protein